MKQSTKGLRKAKADRSTPVSNVVHLADYAHLRKTYERSEAPATIIILPVVRRSPMALVVQA